MCTCVLVINVIFENSAIVNGNNLSDELWLPKFVFFSFDLVWIDIFFHFLILNSVFYLLVEM